LIESTSRRDGRAAVRDAVVSIVVFGLYVVAGKLGLRLAFIHESATAVWPPTGIALATFLVFGRRLWPAIFVGAFTVNILTKGSIPTCLSIAVGNTLEGLLGSWMVDRFAGGKTAFDRPRDTFSFVLLGGLVAPVVSATVGVGTLFVAGEVEGTVLFPTWTTWWLGDMGGALVVAPFLILWTRKRPFRWTGGFVQETVAAYALLIVVGAGVFGDGLPSPALRFPFLTLAPLLWTAKLGVRSAATSSLLLSAIATGYTLQGKGPFSELSPDHDLVVLQIFMAVATMTAMTLASTLDERGRAQEDLRKLNEELEARVADGTAEVKRKASMLAAAERLARIGSWEWDIERDRVVWSDELYRIHGLSPETFRATYDGYLERIHPEDRERIRHVVDQAYRTGQPYEFLNRIVRPDGTVRTVRSHGQVVCDAVGKPIRMFGTGQDLTEEKLLEERVRQLAVEQARGDEIARLNADLERRVRERTAELEAFTYTVAHDLRAPLRAMKGFADLVLEDAANRLQPQEQDYLRRIMTAAARMDALVRDLLAYSRLSRTDLAAEPVELDGLIAETLRQMDSEIRTSHAEIEVDGELPSVLGHRVALSQAIVNLVANAMKFVAAGVAPRIRIMARATDGWVRLAVEDNGIGIANEHRERIFKIFERLHRGESYPGTGIGLAIVRRAVEGMGGRAGVDPRDGGGSRFWIELPAAPHPVRSER
jgi:signal transduction histidine kinase/integral membrane sensor domain MASE1